MRHQPTEQLIEDAPAARVHRAPAFSLRWAIEYLAWLFIIFALAGIFALAVLSPAFAGISAGIKASKERGFARIIIGFSDLPKFESEVAAGIFILSFDKPVDVDVAQVPEDIPEYVGLIRRDPDGRALRIALTRPFQVNIMEAGLELFIDLLPPDWKGLPPPLPAATVKALTERALEVERKQAEEAEQRKAARIPYKLKVRLARHPTFSRIVFQWNKFVTFNLSRKGRTVELKFDKSAKANLSQLKADPPKFLQNIATQDTADGMTMRLTVDEDVDVRGYREGLSYVLDLTGPDALAEASSAALADKIAAENNPAGSKKTARQAGKTEMTLVAGERNEPGTARAAGGGDARIITKDIDPAVLSGRSFAENEPREPDVSPGAAARPGPAPPAEGGKGTAGAGESAGPGSDDVNGPGAETEITAEAQAGSEATTGSAAKSAGKAAEKARAGLRFTFQFDKPVAAAVFRRGRTIWSVFDTEKRLDLQALRRAGKGVVEDVRRISSGKAQVILITLKEPQLVYVTHSGNGWHLTIGNMAGGTTSPLVLVRALRGDKRSLIKIKMKNYGTAHWLTDPEIGDRLAVVTAFPPQRNVAKPQELVDFTTFATAQGIAIRPRTDDVAVRLYLDEVLVTSRSGLTLSAGNASQYRAGKKPLRKMARTGFIDFERWTIKNPSLLSSKIDDMMRLIAEAPESELNARRFDLATLYMANSLYAEALGLLRRMANVDPNVEADPAYNIMRGATLVSMGRHKEAQKDFEVHALANDTDVSLWRGLIASKDQQWADALSYFKEGADAIGAYRPDIRARFRLTAVRAALETDKLSRAAKELNAISRDELKAPLSAELQLMTARYLESVGRTDEAREAYDSALKGVVQPVVAEARLRSVALDLKTGKIDRKQALKLLEGLQLFWRGDDIELQTMRLLADLYVQEKRYSDGFALMRNAMEAFPKNEIAMQIQDDMKQIFKNLFLHGESNEMDPVRALGLYYGNRELTPVGRLGDEMIRRLSDRLVSVDLLDQASELLDHQVTKRLKGAARAQVATRLAMVHLMNHKASLALRVIRRTRQAGLPEDLQKSRNLLEARALGELGRAAAAIEILNTMDGDEVERLKADAYWAAREWKEAGRQIEKILGGRWRDAEPLSDKDRFDVLRAAIGYSLAGDQFALDRMHRKFYPKLLKTADAESFLLVTKPIKAKGIAFRNLAKEIAAIDTLDAFMKEFRSRYERNAPKKRTSAKKAAGQAG